MSNRIKEEDIIIPALKYVYYHPNCNTEQIKKHLMDTIELNPEDKEILEGRNDNKFSQIVRNLISHYDNNKFGKYTERTKVDRYYNFKLNSDGFNFVNELFKEEFMEEMDDYLSGDTIISEDEYNASTDLTPINDREPEPGAGSVSKRYKTDSRLAKTALVKCNYECECGKLLNEKHTTFDAKTGNKYLEAHHLIPMKAQKDFLPKNLDRIENIVGLCPLCHAAIHHGTTAEKMKVLKVIYEDRIKGLNECNQNIDISLTELLIKYYL